MSFGATELLIIDGRGEDPPAPTTAWTGDFRSEGFQAFVNAVLADEDDDDEEEDIVKGRGANEVAVLTTDELRVVAEERDRLDGVVDGVMAPAFKTGNPVDGVRRGCL